MKYLPITTLIIVTISFLATSCSAGTTTESCSYPTFTDATAQSQLKAWGNGLVQYTNYPTNDFFVNAGYFTMSFYTPDGLLQPTLSPIQRIGTQNIYNYFSGFLSNYPQMSFNPESNLAISLGCGYGGYAGYYTFVTNAGTASESVTYARFTFIYKYQPNSFSENFTVESGSQASTSYSQTNPSGWYIDVQQSSTLPNGH